MTPRAMLCSTQDIPAKNVRLRWALITRIGGINLATMFNSPARPHTHTPATASSIKIPASVPPRRALIRTGIRNCFSTITRLVHAHSRLASGKSTYDKRNNTRITPGGISGAARCSVASLRTRRTSTLNTERKEMEIVRRRRHSCVDPRHRLFYIN